MAETEGKKLTELRVIDLKTELERRGLDKTGNKAALLERLSKVWQNWQCYFEKKYERASLVAIFILLISDQHQIINFLPCSIFE